MKGKTKMIWIIGILTFLVAFWFYNFRWVEFIPYESNIRDDRRYGAWIERKEWVTPKRLECFKEKLKIHHHDWLEKNNKLYIRGYLTREESTIYLNWWNNSDKCMVGKNTISLGRDGFFPEYTGYNSFSYFLDKLVMWNWDEPEKKK